MHDFKSIAGYCEQFLKNCNDQPNYETQRQLEALWRQQYAQYAAYTNLLYFQSARLVIFCHHPAMANRIRFEIKSIQQYLLGQNFDISSIDIKVIPQNRRPNIPTKHKASLSENSAKQIIDTANSVSHAPLKRALMRLAQSSKKNSE